MQNRERAMILLQAVEVVLNDLLNACSSDENTNQVPTLKSVKTLVIEAHNELLDI